MSVVVSWRAFVGRASVGRTRPMHSSDQYPDKVIEPKVGQLYICFNKRGLSDWDANSTSVDERLACDSSSPSGGSVYVGLCTRGASLGEVILSLAHMATKV